MNPEDVIKNIENAYNAALKELSLLDAEKRQIITQYIKDLEQKKITEIKQELTAISLKKNHY
jgi:phosphoribosylcarboxyaminoimidazole (NCAIR) mutase